MKDKLVKRTAPPPPPHFYRQDQMVSLNRAHTIGLNIANRKLYAHNLSFIMHMVRNVLDRSSRYDQFATMPLWAQIEQLLFYTTMGKNKLIDSSSMCDLSGMNWPFRDGVNGA